MLGEVHADGKGSQSLYSVTAQSNASHIRVIGPWHPTLVSSDIDNLDILPHPMRADALLSLADITPQAFKG
ncbi:hypothetical protein O181_042902 [Austropuccinia psidii MF-1]|uniref:Uncharacterized protein n=1 Tax=Austropuccinia psidii MF-1 TaxID=1389203 RepID=A0A9Q3HGA4_9BASI|nr:hypothetical protein [Austropuccinia psidii MF-1]